MSGGGGGGGYNLVQDEGSSVTVRTTLNFAGAGVTVTDSGGKTLVTIPGGSSLTAPANPADDGKVAIASGGNLTYATVGNANITNATITLAKMAAIAALSIVANATNASAVPTAVAGTTDQVLRVDGAGTGLGFGSLDLSKAATVGSSKLAFANFTDGSARSVFGRAANSSGVQASIAGGGANTVLVDNGTTISFTTLGLSSLSNIAALTVIGNGTNASAVPTALAGTTDQVMRVSSAGTSLGFGAINLASASAVSGLLAFANIANGSARSVFGRSANSSGVQASIAGAGANTVLVDNGTTIGFAAVPVAALANGTACSVIGRSANSSGAYADISIGTNDHVLMRTSNVVTSGFVADANVAVAAAIAGTKISPNFGSQNVVTTGVISLGTTPASAGTVRIPNAADIRARNAANSADQILVSIDSSNTVGVGDVSGTGIRMTTAGVIGGRIGGSDAITLTSTLLAVPAGAVSIGTNPAAAGAIRIASATTFASRNNANSADLVHTRTNSSDGMFIGEGAASYSIGDNKINIGTHIEISTVQFRFDSAVVAPNILQELDATASVTVTSSPSTPRTARARRPSRLVQWRFGPVTRRAPAAPGTVVPSLSPPERVPRQTATSRSTGERRRSSRPRRPQRVSATAPSSSRVPRSPDATLWLSLVALLSVRLRSRPVAVSSSSAPSRPPQPRTL